MRQSLWPDALESEVDELIELPITEGITLVVAGAAGGGLRGFAEIRLRRFADGCEGSPVAYLEGIRIDREARRGGIASALVREGEVWARSQGLSQFASDCEQENSESEAFHLAVGFEEVQRNITFRRRLSGESA